MEELFKPGRYSLTAIHKAYQMLRDTTRPNALRVPLSVSRLRRDIPALIQDLAGATISGDEDIEDYVQLQKTYWETFMTKVRHAFSEEETPVALFKDPQSGLITIIKKVDHQPFLTQRFHTLTFLLGKHYVCSTM